MEAIRGGFAISARLMLGGVFLLSGIDYSCGYTHIVQQMAAYGTPYPRLMLLIGILLLLAGPVPAPLGTSPVSVVSTGAATTLAAAPRSSGSRQNAPVPLSSQP